MKHDLTGRVFGRLTVIREAPNTTYGAPQWECACACGASANVSARSLRAGDARSCGCLRREHMARVGRSGVGGRKTARARLAWRAA